MVFNVSVIGQVHRIAQAADLKCETPVRIAFSRKAVGPSVVHGKAQASCGDRSRSSRWRSRQRRRSLGVTFKLLHNNEDIYPSSDKDIEPPRLCEEGVAKHSGRLTLTATFTATTKTATTLTGSGTDFVPIPCRYVILIAFFFHRVSSQQSIVYHRRANPSG